MAEEAKWYVVHTYSGYENKVKANIEKSVDNRGISNLIQSVEVPMNEVVEEKDGKEKVVNKKIYPGYVIIKMIMNDESWFVVRNTRGVTGFVGPGSKPVPLTDLEVKNMGVEKSGDSGMKFSVGDSVRVKSGPLEGFSGVIEKVDEETRKVLIMVSMFGRKTPVDAEIKDIELL